MMDKPSAVIDAHATHWASLYPDAPDAIRTRIKSIVEKSSIIAQVELPEARAMPNGGRADTLTAMAEADGDVRHMVLLLTERQTSSGCVLSAFPFAAGAITHPVTIDHVASTGSGAEGPAGMASAGSTGTASAGGGGALVSLAISCARRRMVGASR